MYPNFDDEDCFFLMKLLWVAGQSVILMNCICLNFEVYFSALLTVFVQILMMRSEDCFFLMKLLWVAGQSVILMNCICLNFEVYFSALLTVFVQILMMRSEDCFFLMKLLWVGGQSVILMTGGSEAAAAMFTLFYIIPGFFHLPFQSYSGTQHTRGGFKKHSRVFWINLEFMLYFSVWPQQKFGSTVEN